MTLEIFLGVKFICKSSLQKSFSYTVCDRVHTSHLVWGPLCFSTYSCLVTLKMVSGLCVSLCEAGVQSILFICPPVCLQKHCICLDIIPSGYISVPPHGGQRGSQGEKTPPYVTADLLKIQPVARRNIPFVWQVKESMFGSLIEWVRPPGLVGTREKFLLILVINKHKSLLA